MPWYCVRSLDRDKLAASPESHLCTGCSSHTFALAVLVTPCTLCTGCSGHTFALLQFSFCDALLSSSVVLCSALRCFVALCTVRGTAELHIELPVQFVETNNTDLDPPSVSAYVLPRASERRVKDEEPQSSSFILACSASASKSFSSPALTL